MKNNAFTPPPEKIEMIDNSPAIEFLADMNTRNIRWCNQTMIKTLGYSLDEMKQMGGKLFEIIMHPEDYPNALRTREFFIAGVKRHAATCRFQKKSNGEWKRFYGVAAVHECDKDGKAETLFCSFLELNSGLTSIQVEQVFGLSTYPCVKIESLSCREKELLPYLSRGLDNQEIAEIVFNSSNTIKTHVESIMQKMEVHSRVKLVVLLKNMGY
ncbi:MAG: LuxR C-terminal-related transcriptional regulator [Chitinophagaceae bacterium]